MHKPGKVRRNRGWEIPFEIPYSKKPPNFHTLGGPKSTPLHHMAWKSGARVCVIGEGESTMWSAHPWEISPLSVKKIKLECGRMPNVMAALPHIGGALCSTPQSLADADY